MLKFYSILLICLVTTNAIHTAAHEEIKQFKSAVAPIAHAAKKLALERAANKKLPIPIMGIAGCSAVGKSTFTKKLAYILKKEGINVLVIKLDDFQPQPLTDMERLLSHRVHTAMQEILAGKEHIVRPAWDKTWATQTKEDVTTCLHDIDLILVEGLYALCGPDTPYDILKYLSCKIYIDASEDLIRSWNWKRELKAEAVEGRTPRTKEKFDADIDWDMEDYHKVILPCKQVADFIISKDERHQLTIICQSTI